jgi:hypothetical protein
VLARDSAKLASDAQDLLDDIKEMQADSAGNFVLMCCGLFDL